jgi:hypothetical protein
MYEPRKYRDLFKGENLVFFNCTVRETDLQVGANRAMEREVRSAVLKYREQLEDYARSNPEFLVSLSPVEAKPWAPEIVKRMCWAGQQAGVGPMAAVAGALSEFVGREMLVNRYTREIIVENGGDIFIKTDVPRKIGVYAGSSPLNQQFAIEVQPDETPLGICTSAGTVGHSLSFGNADAAVILARDCALADAVATATGNRAVTESDLERAVSFASGIADVVGALAIMGDRMAAWGDIRLVDL